MMRQSHLGCQEGQGWPRVVVKGKMLVAVLAGVQIDPGVLTLAGGFTSASTAFAWNTSTVVAENVHAGHVEVARSLQQATWRTRSAPGSLR